MTQIYLDNADNFSLKENLNKEITFLKKVKSKTQALLNIFGGLK